MRQAAVTSWLGWPPWVWLVVDALAVYRLARLVARDTILRGLRRWVAGRYEGLAVEGMTCMWCLTVWFAAAVVALTYFVPWWWSWPASALALSAAAGFLAGKESL